MRYKRKLSEAQTQTQKVITIMIKQIEIKGKLNCYKLAIIKIVLSVIPRKEMFLMGWKSIQKFKNENKKFKNKKFKNKNSKNKQTSKLN